MHIPSIILSSYISKGSASIQLAFSGFSKVLGLWPIESITSDRQHQNYNNLNGSGWAQDTTEANAHIEFNSEVSLNNHNNTHANSTMAIQMLTCHPTCGNKVSCTEHQVYKSMRRVYFHVEDLNL
jgi:hypothetical protein